MLYNIYIYVLLVNMMLMLIEIKIGIDYATSILVVHVFRALP